MGRVGNEKCTRSKVTWPATWDGRAPPSIGICGCRASSSKIQVVAPRLRIASAQNDDALRNPRATRNAYRMNEINVPEVSWPRTIR